LKKKKKVLSLHTFLRRGSSPTREISWKRTFNNPFSLLKTIITIYFTGKVQQDRAELAPKVQFSNHNILRS
jgi:hypothetical protein